MKTLKFTPELAQLVLDEKKTTTWRMFDDKDLQPGDELELMNKATMKVFAHAKITEIAEKPLGALGDADWEGHERFTNEDEMYKNYRGYYPGREIGPDTIVKIVHFELAGR